MSFLSDLFAYSFLFYALLAALLSSFACGIVGSFVVVKKIGHIAGGISHAILGGMGAAVFIGLHPSLGALISALIAATLIGIVSLRSEEQETTFINALWAIGMAIGVLQLMQQLLAPLLIVVMLKNKVMRSFPHSRDSPSFNCLKIILAILWIINLPLKWKKL